MKSGLILRLKELHVLNPTKEVNPRGGGLGDPQHGGLGGR